MPDAKDVRTAIPALRYRDAHAAIAWLGKAFGFHPQAVYDGPNNTVAHAQLTLGTGMIMLGSASNDSRGHRMLQPDQAGGSTASIYLVVPDAAATYETAKASGAEIIMPLQEMDYGGKGFGCTDPEGHNWSIGEYNPWP